MKVAAVTISLKFPGVGCSKVYKYQNSKWTRVKLDFKLVEGTILYGEIVQEHNISEKLEAHEKRSLHVIDALRLGDTSLADLSFAER